jgi:hypothetical protein
MMKKILSIALVLLFTSISLFGQTKQEELINANGHDWTQWHPSQQYAWVFGFVYAMETVRTIIYFDQSIDKVDKDRYLKYFYFCCIEDVGNAIEYYYKTYPDDLDATIWSVVLVMFEKHWWSPNEEGVEDSEEQMDLEEMFKEFQEIDPRINPDTNSDRREYATSLLW